MEGAVEVSGWSKNGFRDKNGKVNTYRESQGNFGKRGGKARVAILDTCWNIKSQMHLPTCDNQSATSNGHVSDFNSNSYRPNVDYRAYYY